MAYTYTNIDMKQKPTLVRWHATVAIDGATGTFKTPLRFIEGVYFTITSGTGGAGAGANRCRITPSTTASGTLSFAGWTGDEVVEVYAWGKGA